MSAAAQFLRTALALALSGGLGLVAAYGQKPRSFHEVGVEVSWNWETKPLRFGGAVNEGKESNKHPRQAGLGVTRVDFLMSELALRRADGSWLETGGWFACFRGSHGMNRAVLDGVPSQEYSGLRFKVGVPAAENHEDPNRWPAGHPLHPSVNGLHWGWQGGYIFMALEGHWQQQDGRPGGFSYHLAGDDHLMTVMLDGPMDLRRGGTIGVEIDVGKILGGLDPAVFGESTHSRAGDERSLTLKARAEQAFSLTGVMPEVWQDSAAAAPVAGAPPPAENTPGTPFPLRISNRLPQVKLPVDNQLTLEGVALGSSLFHDTRLSSNNTQSCASCHDRGAAFADPGQRFSLGAEGLAGKRNAMPLFNLAWQTEFFWDGRTKRLRDQVLEPIKDPVEMHLPLDLAVEKLQGDGGYVRQFTSAFGTPGVTSERIGFALEQFLLTLVSQDSKFDQAVRGETKLTPMEQRGLELFVTEHDPARNLRGADCFHCHGGNLFTNQGFANNGLDAAPAAGRGAVTGLAADTGKFRVPSLRNIAATAPYMHDGRFVTLEQVIDHYDHGVQRTDTLDPNLAKHPSAGLGLSAPDKAALAAFLRTLTDESFLKSDPAHPALTASKP